MAGQSGEKGTESGKTLHRSPRRYGKPGVQWRKAHQDGWTPEKQAEFLDVLSATSNVTEAARAVGMSKSGVYALRRRDAAFNQGWRGALELAYAELEMLLLRKAIHGTEQVQTVPDEDGEGVRTVKTVHSYPLAVALRLFLAHGSSVAAFRSEQGIDGPGSESALAEIREKFALMRARKASSESGGDDGTGAA
ncbi:hypothetical protein [Sphingobium subterraneum]|uniref:hypothetical protein n=1 Tax=Sphingobium subterraneum TaxID=627688 RepID=UPI001C84892A|nr:hypothetical protein [Sphingobium subterraneum]